MMANQKQAAAAADFAKRWEGKGYEKGESQVFWTELLTEVFGIEKPSTFITFEQQAQLDHTSFIDVLIPSTHVMIEQKSIDKDINKPIRQSDGMLLTPFQQAQRYSAVLPYSQRPRWIVICNFREFAVHDMENPNGEPYIILLKDLGKDARAKYPDSCLADLYDPNLMPYDLLQAHRENDRAVMAAYGFSTKMSESECVAALFNLYSELTKDKK